MFNSKDTTMRRTNYAEYYACTHINSYHFQIQEPGRGVYRILLRSRAIFLPPLEPVVPRPLNYNLSYFSSVSYSSGVEFFFRIELRTGGGITPPSKRFRGGFPPFPHPFANSFDTNVQSKDYICINVCM